MRTTARGVARLLATVIVLGVAVVLALHAFVSPGLDTAPIASVGARDVDADAREVSSLGLRRSMLPQIGRELRPHRRRPLPRLPSPRVPRQVQRLTHAPPTPRSPQSPSIVATSSSSPTDWVTPTYLISLPGRGTEEDRLEANLVKLVQAHGVAAVSANI